ncbi:MAG: reverse transcriptase domain-containing protein [Candidatus Thiodiazotropha sp.]
MEDYMHRNGLLCINDGQATRRNSDSVIDLFIVTPRVIPEVVICETMSCEAIRSDHIGILLEVYQGRQKDSAVFEKFMIRKAKWEVWRECSEEKFKAWNEAGTQYSCIDDMVEAFMEVYTECMVEAVPKSEIKVHSRRKKPPWWDDEVKVVKNELNKAKKSFRRRRTPNNFEDLKVCEARFEEVKEAAKISWTKQLCDTIAFAGSAKEMWESFNTLTTYQDFSRGGVLPLIDKNNRPVFQREEKCEVLEKVFFGGSHLEDCSFDESFREGVEKDIKDIHEGTLKSNQDSEDRCSTYLNHNISMEEVEAVIQQLKQNKSPGPDEVYTEMLKNAGKEFLEAILRLFQMSWQTSTVPMQWKKAEVKFLRKSGKKGYHDPGAYRPISLTSYLCKCLERIITYRLYGFVEHFSLLDKEQEGFRRFRGTSDALLRVSQEIFNGFNSRKHTAALLIDVEKAYDSVWRDGLMHKLWKMGITGKIWSWISNFLLDRTAAINMSGVRAQEFGTKVGLPQGSVISPLLFNLFIADCFKEVLCEKVKFADDGTIWITGENWRDLLEQLQLDFGKVIQWAKKWRLKLSMAKTEFCLFSMDNKVIEEARSFKFSVAGQTLKYNPNPKLLGVTLDEKLKFDLHIENVERKALKSLEQLRKVKETEVINSKCMLQLYKALVVPQFEYASSVWQIGNCSPLEKVQRKGLAMCLGIPGTAGLEALEVEAGIKPLAIRREELAIRQAAKVMMKGNESYIKRSWDSFVDSDVVEHRVSPFGKMNVQLADMASNTGISLHNLEKEFNYQESLQPSKAKPEYWHTLGSSKSRSLEQEALSRELVGEMIDKCDSRTVIAFTDGSCLGNPGPCGAGASVFPPGCNEPVLLKRPVSSRGSILLGELVAIKMAINHVFNTCSRNQGSPGNINSVHIFSDSQSAIGNLTLGWEAKNHKTTIQEVKADIKKLQEAGIQVDISWTPGHADIKGNEQADQMAKEAANEAKEMGEAELQAVTTLGDVKAAAKESGSIKWQEMWEKAETGRHLYYYRPKVGFKIKHSFQSAVGERIIAQLRTGYARLNEYLYKTGITDSNECMCGAIESVSHYLIDCPLYENEREIMRKRLFQSCGIPQLDMNLLLMAKKEDEFKEWRNCILTELETYVATTERFATRTLHQ